MKYMCMAFFNVQSETENLLVKSKKNETKLKSNSLAHEPLVGGFCVILRDGTLFMMKWHLCVILTTCSTRMIVTWIASLNTFLAIALVTFGTGSAVSASDCILTENATEIEMWMRETRIVRFMISHQSQRTTCMVIFWRESRNIYFCVVDVEAQRKQSTIIDKLAPAKTLKSSCCIGLSLKIRNNVVFIFLPPSLARERVGRSIECLLRCYCVALCYGYLLELNYKYKFSDWSFANIHFNLEKWDRMGQRALHATRKRFLKIASRMIWISLSSHDDGFSAISHRAVVACPSLNSLQQRCCASYENTSMKTNNLWLEPQRK